MNLREQLRFPGPCEENSVKSRRKTKKEAAEEARICPVSQSRARTCEKGRTRGLQGRRG